jgi:putative phosphoesterase
VKVCLLSDVHGNLPALEAVLADADARGAMRVWNLGDATGYGPFPDEVVAALRGAAELSILGNYDAKVLAFPANKAKWQRKKTPDKYLAFRWAYEALSDESREWLATLQPHARATVESVRVLLVHGSPDAIDEAVSDATPEARLVELAARADADLVLAGHTHAALDRTAGGVRFVNPGSVGRPEGDDPRASYAILDFHDGQVDVEPIRLDYDVERTVRELEALGLPNEFGQMLRTGRNYDEVGLADAPRPARAGDTKRLAAVCRLARECDYEAAHTHQVTRLSLMLFDELVPLHGLGDDERFYLQCAAMLHDIGWMEGQRRHHKTALRAILSADLPFDDRERLIVASIARYHRKALPSTRHDHFAALDAVDRRTVRILGGILRVADGLDRSHLSLVRRLTCTWDDATLTIHARTAARAEPERWAAAKKSDLLADALGREVVLALSPAER